jgi:periplasmic protein TonB
MSSSSYEPMPERRGDHRRTMAIAATLAIHVLLAVGADMVSVYGKKREREVAPTVELIDVDLPPPPPPPPPAPEPPPPQVAAVPPPPTRAPRPPSPPRAAATIPPPTTSEPPPPTPADSSPGGSPTVALPSAPPSARGVAVRKGPVNPGPVGRGGEGGGTGAGSGAGSGDKPVSVAMIKKQAKPKGDYDYFDAGKDYPPAARQLGIQGKIRVRLTVSDSGAVTAAVLLNKLGHGLDETALARARKLEFDPATDTTDKPVPSIVVWTFTFTLPEAAS